MHALVARCYNTLLMCVFVQACERCTMQKRVREFSTGAGAVCFANCIVPITLFSKNFFKIKKIKKNKNFTNA